MRPNLRGTSPRNLTVPLAMAVWLLGATPAAAHDDAPEHHHAAAERARWDTVTRELVEGEWLLERGDPAGARQRLERAREIAPADARTWLFAAALALREHDARAADSLATHAIGAGASSGAAHRTRARARLARRDADGALADFAVVVESERGHHEEAVLEFAHATHALRGAAPALALLEQYAIADGWTPARRALAEALDRELGLRSPSRPARAAAPVPASPLAARAASPHATSALDDTLVRRGGAWKWFAGPSLPPGAWTAREHDDSAWNSGPAPLGYGEPRVVTTLPDGGVASQRWITSCLRAHFSRPAGAMAPVSLVLRTDYDDGFIAWLNGVEVARRGLPTGAVSWGTLAATHESGTLETIVVPTPGLLVPGDNVLAIELHQSSPSSSDLFWDAELVADSLAVARTRGPYLQNAAPTAISVRWRTAAPIVGRVSIGPAGGPYAWVHDEPVARTEHEVRVTGLTPATAYAYSVHGTLEAPEAVSEARTFGTPPSAGTAAPVRVWAIGDSGYGNLPGRQVRDAYLNWSGSQREDLWLLLGDNAYTTGSDAEYQAGLFDQYPLTLSRSPLWSARGNHDLLYSGVNNDYYDLFTLPTSAECGGVPSGTEAWYSFDWGPVHFVCLDSEGSDRSLASPMLQWLRADLAATSQPWVIGFWHHPPYTKGSHDSDNPLDSGGRMRDMRERVLPILDSLGVDLVLAGHSHSYERSALLRQHYGTSGTLTPAMLADSGDGRVDGDGAYEKHGGHPGPLEGTVYAVNGSASQVSGGSLHHPAMVVSLNVLGSMVLDVAGERLDARFLDAAGTVRDSFTVLKRALLAAPGGPGDAGIALAPASPAPFHDRTELRWRLPRGARAVLTVYDIGGRRVRTLASGWRPPGEHRVTWDGRDSSGEHVPAGAYLVQLEADGVRRTRRVVRLP